MQYDLVNKPALGHIVMEALITKIKSDPRMPTVPLIIPTNLAVSLIKFAPTATFTSVMAEAGIL